MMPENAFVRAIRLELVSVDPYPSRMKNRSVALAEWRRQAA